ncbi:hypothetical protein [Paenibacillus sp. Marseille-Q4541]|uniref:hypothetical protein n=1 Tax=Paenibacillus sp. Marseille-Q4541 TaxID=2831522 RepID=UPI001BAA54F8|nr:hypothetical protein [Paenibacillus sp. Marseille-Q4541]
MLSYQVICLVIYLCLSAGALIYSLWLRQKVGQIWFDGQGKQQPLLTTLVFILGGVYLITGTGLIKYALFIIAFIVHYFVTRFYLGTHGIKWGTRFYTFDQIKGYRQYNETNELTLYLKGKPEEILLRPRIAYLSSTIRQFLDREGIPNESDNMNSH